MIRWGIGTFGTTPSGNVTIEIDDYGPSPHFNVTTLNAYGDQSELLTAVRPEGNSVSYAYDALLNPLSIRRTPKPGSALSPQVENFTYVVPATSLPNFEEVRTITDPNNNVTTYTCNPNTGTLAKIDQPTVTRAWGGGEHSRAELYLYSDWSVADVARRRRTKFMCTKSELPSFFGGDRWKQYLYFFTCQLSNVGRLEGGLFKSNPSCSAHPAKPQKSRIV
jgi:YD repeat-containing protein